MTPGARIEAAIHLVQAVLEAPTVPADAVLRGFFRARRYMGSSDRSVIAGWVYGLLRRLACIRWQVARAGGEETARSLVFAWLLLRENMSQSALNQACSGGRYHPAPLQAREKNLCQALEGAELVHEEMPRWVRHDYPEWMDASLSALWGLHLPEEMAALNREAPVDLRAQGYEAQPTRCSPWGVRLPKRGALFALPEFGEGWFEMQDEASQLVALLADARPGQKVIDLCAGAGGKTLALAASMENKGRMLALDISARRMAELPKRLRRAGVHNVQSRLIASAHDVYLKRHAESADRVLVDAPCTGSGTWRRNPDLKWRARAEELPALLATQAQLLESAARLVKPGGRIIYATCSLLPEENEIQVERWLSAHAHFGVVRPEKIWNNCLPDRSGHKLPYLRVSPHQDGMDGFFAAVFERVSA